MKNQESLLNNALGVIFKEEYVSLGNVTKLVYTYILSSYIETPKVTSLGMAYVCMPQTTIAKRLGVARSSVQVAMVELQQVGLFRILQNGKHKCNVIIIPGIQVIQVQPEPVISQGEIMPSAEPSEPVSQFGTVAPEREIEEEEPMAALFAWKNTTAEDSSLVVTDSRSHKKKNKDYKKKNEDTILNHQLPAELEADTKKLVLEYVAKKTKNQMITVGGNTYQEERIRNQLQVLDHSDWVTLRNRAQRYRPRNLAAYIFVCAIQVSGVAQNTFSDFHQREYTSNDWNTLEVAMLQRSMETGLYRRSVAN